MSPLRLPSPQAHCLDDPCTIDFSPKPIEIMDTLILSQSSSASAQQQMSPLPSPQAHCLDDVLDFSEDFSPKPIETIDTMEILLQKFFLLPAEQKLTLVNEMLCSVSATDYGVVIPNDYLLLSVMGMKHLESTGRGNVLYELAKGLGTMRPDGSDSYFPTSRMPMGLLEYMVNFFNAKPGQNVCTQCTCRINVFYSHIHVHVGVVYK